MKIKLESVLHMEKKLSQIAR